MSSQAYVGQMKTNSTKHRSQYYVKELHIFSSTHIIQHYLTDQLKRNTCLISNGNVFSNCMFERYTNNGGCLLNRFLNSFRSFWNCLLIAFFNHLLFFTLYVNADDVLTSAKVMKFVRASHCVCPILGLSSSGSVLLVQTMHPDPPGTSRHIRETQSNKTELLSNTHVLTSSALPYGSVIKPWREVFLSMCVCLCVPMSSQEHKQTHKGGICWQQQNRTLILLMKYKEKNMNMCSSTHPGAESLSVFQESMSVQASANPFC